MHNQQCIGVCSARTRTLGQLTRTTVRLVNAQQSDNPIKGVRPTAAVHRSHSDIHEATQETAKVMANQKLLAKELANNQRQMADWHSKAETAVKSGDDDLARKALSRKRKHQKLVVALQDQWNSAEVASSMLKHQLEGMQAKLAEAKRSLAILSARQRTADFRKKMHSTPGVLDAPLDDDNAFAKFDRLRARVEQAEAEADALAELRGVAPSAQTAEAHATTAADDNLDAELARLKSKSPD